jgi:hypothetical protein
VNGLPYTKDEFLNLPHVIMTPEREWDPVTAFTMAFRDNSDQFCMSMVLNSKTTEWPSGQSWEIIQELQDEFAPIDMMGEAEQQRELEAIHMRKHANPKTLFSQITAIENKCAGD